MFSIRKVKIERERERKGEFPFTYLECSVICVLLFSELKATNLVLLGGA